ncbi:MAG: hypothetical protein G8345_11940, partial [Magnetococcales bacterium]|nr:hypothetical protein [Magnetococcales bacterium]NGZ27583.1 hypothetical protein [Magnetococcales bacterium]
LCLLHTLKGMAGNISAYLVLASSQRLEHILKPEIEDQLLPVLRELQQNIQQVCSSMEQIMALESGREEASLPTLERVQLEELILDLDRMLERKNVKSIALFEKLQQELTHTPSVTASLQRMNEPLSHYDFSLVRLLLRKLTLELGFSLFQQTAAIDNDQQTGAQISDNGHP